MKNLPVHWHEGLFLRPHHLQAADRYWDELVSTSLRWDTPYNYGLHSLSFSEEALANHQLDVRVLRARMRDGTVIDLEMGQEPDRVDLKEAVSEVRNLFANLGDSFEHESVIRVYLAVPKLKLGRVNSGASDSEEDVRFRETQMSVEDENRGGHDNEIQFRELNVRLLLSTQDLTGYELLPIAQIKRTGEGEARPVLDTEYIPPLLITDAWPGLRRDIVRALYDVIGQKIDVLSQQLINRDIGRENRDPGDADRISMLEKLNEAYASLSVLAFAQGIHPLVIYHELCRILGQLSVFTDSKRVSDIPAYDHEDLSTIFRRVKLRIETIIRAVRDYEFEQRFFVGVGMGMQVSLEPKWFHSNWQWCIGVRKGDLSEQECRELLSPGQLDWKLGSSRQVELLFKRRAEGLQLRAMDRAIGALPARQDWMYYEVVQNESAAWRDVFETQTLAVRLKDSLILNQDKLQGERDLVCLGLGKKG